MKKFGIFLSSVIIVLGLSVSAHALLMDMDDGTVYDTDTRLSWLKDAAAGGAKNWADANVWAASLNAGTGFAGFTNWRLPATIQPDASCSDQLSPGGVFPLQGWNFNCVNSELGHLYYISLGNTAGGPLINVGPFTNLQADSFWSGTYYAPTPSLANGAWYFYFSNGFQYVSDCGIFSAWSVRPGLRPLIHLPRTGQTTSYYADDDGYVQAGVGWPTTRFTSNGDQTRTDNLTGLIWAEDAGTPGTQTCSGGPGCSGGYCTGGTMTWQAALDYVSCLNASNYLQHNDWRLPNINELRSLVNVEQTTTLGWLSGQGFTNLQSFNYWSSTSGAVDTSVYAWCLEFDDEIVDYDSKSNAYYVWPVRGGQSGDPDPTYPANVSKTGQTQSYYPDDDGNLESGVSLPLPRFTNNGDQTVTDNLTGLMWTKDAGAPTVSGIAGLFTCTGGAMHWQPAPGQPLPLDYVWCLNFINYLNYNDWRLPNINELHSLVDKSIYNPALSAGHPFDNVQSTHYWSSTAHAGYSGDMWSVDFYGGGVYYGDRDPGSFVWPVRGGTITIPFNAAPVADSSGPYSVGLGSGVTFNGSGSYDPDAGDSIALYTWDISGATYTLLGSGPSLSATDVSALGVGTYTVALTVRDNHGAVGTASTTLTISSVIPGTDVPVTPDPDIDIIFDEVTTGGNVTVTQLSNPSPPANFTIPSGTSYEVTFTGTFTGSVTICFHYNDADINGNENNLKLMHRGANGWDDITLPSNPPTNPNPDTVNNIICGVTTSFSEFAIMEPIVNRPPVAAFFSGYPQQSGWTVTVSDGSTDPDGNMTGSTAITVKWGDGSYSRCAPGGTVTHTYAVAKTYTISLSATDDRGLPSETPATAPVTISLGRVTGTVTSGGLPVSLAKVQITRPGGPNPYTYTNSLGQYTINNVKPGTVTMTATKGATNYGTKSVSIVSSTQTVDFP